jgi:hypothetical protein
MGEEEQNVTDLLNENGKGNESAAMISDGKSLADFVDGDDKDRKKNEANSPSLGSAGPERTPSGRNEDLRPEL